MSRRKHRQNATRRQARRLFLETLEPRQMMTVVSINTLGGSVGEGSTGYFEISRDVADSQPLTVYFTITGSATEIADYEDIGVSATIPANAVSVMVPIDSHMETEFEPNENVVLNLNANAAYTVSATAGAASLTIVHCSGYTAGPTAKPPSCPTCPPGAGESLNTGPGIRNPNLPLSGRRRGIVFGDDQLGQGVPANNPDVGVQPNPLPNGTIFNFSPAAFSSHPIRYTDGVMMLSSTDLASDGMGVPWGITRSWTNAQAHYQQNEVGTRMILSEQPYIRTEDNSRFFVFTNAYTARGFDLVSGVYVARDFAQEKLTHDATNNEFVLTDTEGGVLRFYDLSTNHPELQRGQFKSFTDAKGNTVSVTSHTTEGRVAEVQRSYTDGGNTIIESYLYTHLSTLINNGLMESVVQRRKVGSGSWVTQRSVEYAYYGNGENYGNRGDLKTATIKDAAGNTLDTTYYRYYKPNEANGFAHGLKYVLGPASHARFSQEVGNPLTATDSALAPYADNYFEYDSYLKVTKEIAQGAGCSACSGGQGTFTYSYTGNFNGGYVGSSDYNVWTRKTVETLPDGNQNIVYANFRGQVMLQIFKDTTTSQEWATFYRYDSAGRVLFRAETSAISGYDEGYSDLLGRDYATGRFSYLRDNAGLITAYTYSATTTATTSTPGSVAGYLEKVTIQQGELADPIQQAQQTYIASTAGSTTIYLPASSTVYANTDGTGALTTSYAYSFFSGTVQIESQTTTDPAGGVDTVVFDTYGRPTWKKDAKGFLHYAAYDNQTGAVIKAITDVNSSQTGDFTGKPSGWTTPTGGGLHLITNYEVDGLGRTTKETDANGNITYIVYNDANHEVRVYPGWNTTTNLPTGPTIVMREDQARSYTEVLTMAATPNLTSGRPNGTESISGLQSLTRSHLNDAGQAIYEDNYFSLTGLTYSTSASLGTQGTHFYRTELGYDNRGRQARTVRPDGTIYRTVFDGQGRPVSEWVGDDDTPETGYWSPSNPAGMVKVKEYQFDGGGVGDSLLTSVADALGRATTLAYDFRGRLTTTTLPDPDGGGGPLTSPVYATAYDNLGRVTSQTDALGNVTAFAFNTSSRTTTITLADPDAGGPAANPTVVLTYDAIGLLVSQTDPVSAVTTYEFDGAMRLKKVTRPDPDAGGPLTAPVVQQSYDGAGNVRFVTDPLGRVTEHVYDKANRPTQTIAPDPDAGGPLSSPVTSFGYTAAGLLGTVTDPLTRVTMHEYDALGRRTKTTLPDPDAGGPLTAPVTQWAYDAASRNTTVTDPLSNVTTYAYNFYDQLTSVTQADPDAGGPLSSPVASYTYNAANELLSQTDPLSRTTDFTYDNLSRRIKTTLPDPDAGGPLARPETALSYDAVGNLLQEIDPLGNRKVYQYDNLYRTIAEKKADGNVPIVSISTTTQGGTANEVQRVGYTKTYAPISGGTFTLTYSGQTTGNIAYNASAATVQAALEALSNIGTGNVDVTKLTDSSESQTWQVTFQGSLAGTNAAQITINTLGLDYGYTFTKVEVTVTEGYTASEVQVVTLSDATGGTFKLSSGGQTTAAIAYNATAATVDSALEALSTVDTVTVTGNAGGPYTITFTGTHTGQNVGLLGVDYSGLTNADLLTQTRFSYDAAGRMLSLTDPVSNTTTWQYDALGRVTFETNQLNKTRTFTYDTAGNLTERVDRLGRKIEYVYDNLDRNTAEKWYTGTTLVRTLSFTFDAASQLTAASDPAASYSYTLDNLGRVTNETQAITGLTPQIQYQSKYDAASRRTELQAILGSTADFKNTYTYDNLHRLTVLEQQGTAGGHAVAEKRVDFAYNAASQSTKVTRYADLSGFEFVSNTFSSYDGMGRLAKLLHSEDTTAPSSGWGTEPLAGYEYVYDAASRFTSINSYADGQTTYTHDATSQLTGADHTGQTDESYSYDANGNRTMSGYSTGTNNQLTTDGVYNYTYDDEGNRLTRTKISNGKIEEYTWDHRNRLTKITFKNSDQTVTKTVDQFYDVFNRWVRRCVDPNGSNDVDTFFSYEDGQVALQFDDGGAASDLGHRYLLNPDVVDQLLADEQVTSLTTAGTMLRPFGDHLGTLRDLATYNASTDDTAIANHRRYDSFGKLISETVSAVDEIFGFTGRALDDSTGLQNNLNRWYDSAVGRWVSEDPKGFHANDRNLNRYVANSSLVLVDPTGLQPPGGPYDKPRDDGGPFEKALDEASPELRRLMLELYELQRRGDLGAYQELIQIIDRLDRPSHEVEISRREFDCQINNVLPFYKDYLYALYRFQSAMEQANAALKEVAAALAAYNKARYDLQKAIFDYSAPPPIREPAPGSEGNPAPDPSALEQAMKLNKIRLAQIAVAAALNALQAAGLKGLIAAAAANYWWDEVQKAKGVLDQKLSENKVTICTELDRRTKQTWPWLPIPERKPRRGPGER
jgi:RHS repeat-associated protein